MQLFLLLTFLVALIGTGLIGIRLTAVGLRTRQAPELVYGFSLLFAGTGGVVRLIVHGILGGGPEHHGWLIAAASLRLATLLALSWGIRLIFRADRRWAWFPMYGLWALGLAGGYIVVLYPGGLADLGILYLLGDVANGVATVWGAIESFAYYTKMNRRMALGLADPVVVQRFKSWGFGFSFGGLATIVLVGGTYMTGDIVTGYPVLMLLIQGCMVAMTAATWCAFYPPEWLKRRARERANRLAA